MGKNVVAISNTVETPAPESKNAVENLKIVAPGNKVPAAKIPK